MTQRTNRTSVTSVDSKAISHNRFPQVIIPCAHARTHARATTHAASLQASECRRSSRSHRIRNNVDLD
jgi:hypothetical protein